MARQKKAARGLTGASGGGNDSLTTGLSTVNYSTNRVQNQALSSLVDLAQYEFDNELDQARRFQALADQHRRRAFRAFDLLREYQKLIPTSGGQAQ